MKDQEPEEPAQQEATVTQDNSQIDPNYKIPELEKPKTEGSALGMH